MRIAINASILDATPSGLGVYAANLINAMAQQHEEYLIYTAFPKNLIVSSTKVRGAPIATQPSRGRWGHAKRIAWIQGVLPFRMCRDRAEIFFSPVTEGMLCPGIPQVIVILDLHPLHFPEFWPQRHFYFRYIVPLLLRKCRAIIAISEYTARDIAAFYGQQKVHVISPGYDEDQYKIGLDPSGILAQYNLKSYLLYVGNMLPHKNLHRLIEAFARVAGRVSSSLVIVGKRDPRYFPALEKEVHDRGLFKKTLFLDYLPAGELPALYAGAMALVLPSLHEGFGLTALEAMACGTPVMAANKSSVPEVTGDSAILFDPYNVAEMANAIETVLSHADMRREMREKGLQQAKKFSWQNSARMTLQVLHDVLHETQAQKQR